MKRDIIVPDFKMNSSFLSCEKDMETVLKALFIDNKQYSNMLKRLLIINMPDCLSNLTEDIYNNKIKISLKELIDQQYVRIIPKLTFGEFAETKAYIVISFDNFSPTNTNPQFRDCTLHFDIICHTDEWQLDNYQLRPIKIMGYIDAILNGARLSGIGTLNFVQANELILDENLSGYTLVYEAVHGSDDRIEGE